MTWLTFRQLRASAAGLYAVVAAAVVVLAVTGPALARLHHPSPAQFFDRLTSPTRSSTTPGWPRRWWRRRSSASSGVRR